MKWYFENHTGSQTNLHRSFNSSLRWQNIGKSFSMFFSATKREFYVLKNFPHIRSFLIQVSICRQLSNIWLSRCEFVKFLRNSKFYKKSSALYKIFHHLALENAPSNRQLYTHVYENFTIEWRTQYIRWKILQKKSKNSNSLVQKESDIWFDEISKCIRIVFLSWKLALAKIYPTVAEPIYKTLAPHQHTIFGKRFGEKIKPFLLVVRNSVGDTNSFKVIL